MSMQDDNERKELIELESFIQNNDPIQVAFCRYRGLSFLGMVLGDSLMKKRPNLCFENTDFLENYGINTYYTHDIRKSFDLFSLLIRNFRNKITTEYFKLQSFNRHFGIKLNLRRYTDYPDHIVHRIVNHINTRPESHRPEYTFSITTCKRLDLFERTMNSFLRCCSDIHLIDRWICMDDNSSTEDREKMKLMYPFFEFYFKTPEEKGHAQSMNKILELVNQKGTNYLFHMEDDWEYLEVNNYLTMCSQVLSNNPMYGQCLINRDYAETETSFDCAGSIMKRLPNGFIFFEHVFNPGNHFFPNSLYWKHYSLRPSLIKYSVLETIGKYNSSAGHFEAEYADRYYEKGYLSAFLPDIYSYHIGKLTSERNKANAYVLNQEKQFGQINGYDLNRMKIKVINLDKRPDRMETFKSKYPLNKVFTRFSAVDGMKLKSSPDLYQLFRHNDYNFRRGITGCALSHLQLWMELAESDSDHYFIMEDDVDFSSEFNDNKLIELMTENESKFDIFYLGHTNHSRVCIDKGIHQLNKQQAFFHSIGGLFGYVMSKKCAQMMLEFIDKHSITNGIDWMTMNASDEIRALYLHPPMITTTCYSDDSNINRIYDCVPIDEMDKDFCDTVSLSEETKYFPRKNGKYCIDDILDEFESLV